MPPPSFASWLARMTVRPKLGKQVVQEIPAPGTANSADLWGEHCCDLCEKIDKRIIDNARPSTAEVPAPAGNEKARRRGTAGSTRKTRYSVS